MAADEINEVKECPRRGRPRLRRIIAAASESRCYKPCCCPEEAGTGISLNPDEIELIRLIDLEGLEQEEAAEKLGVSRKTAWRISMKHDARSLTHWSMAKVSRWPAAQKPLKAAVRSVRSNRILLNWSLFVDSPNA